LAGFKHCIHARNSYKVFRSFHIHDGWSVYVVNAVILLLPGEGQQPWLSVPM
jgi:hypothetical protein